MKNNKAKSTANLFVTGVVVLTIANLLVKVIGVALKVPLDWVFNTGVPESAKGDAMGFYSAAYDVYVWLYMISTAGLPVAISMMVSESRAKGNLREPKKIFSMTLALLTAVGTVGTCILIFGSRYIANNIYKLPGLEYALCAIAPTLLFICISAAIRGYFQGYQIMTPSAVSEVIESFGKLVFGMTLAYIAMNMLPADLVMLKDGIEGKYAIAAAMTISGLTLGVGVSLIYLFIKKATFKSAVYDLEFKNHHSYDKPVRSNAKIIKSLIAIAIPITISSSVMSFTSMLDGVIISNTMQDALKLSADDVTGIIGLFKTHVVTLFNMPPALIYPISGSIVPYLSGIIAKGDKEKATKIMNSSLRVATMIALPCALGLSTLSEPIIRLFFNSSFSPDTCNTPALLSIQAIAVFFVGMLAMTTSILQAHKQERKPIISMLAGGAVKILSSYLLIGKIGIYGAPVGTLLCYITIVLFNFFFVAKYVKFIPRFTQVFLKPLISAVICSGAALLSYRVLEHYGLSFRIAVIAAILIAMVVYAIMIILLRALRKEDFEIIPKGQKLYNILSKARLIK
ncbi:MAG: polysaccharide biosynthesis protein [Clostridia bacterium]|nr:polysaccharide biosynthesis protein [Clostridia bacterium]